MEIASPKHQPAAHSSSSSLRFFTLLALAFVSHLDDMSALFGNEHIAAVLSVPQFSTGDQSWTFKLFNGSLQVCKDCDIWNDVQVREFI